MRELSLFTGAGGGILGTHLLGWTPIGYVEWDDYCQRVLAARIADGLIARAPIFGDVRQFVESGAAREYRGFADVVTAGFPCQPHSVAGKQLGADDPRDMWPATAAVIRDIRPRSVMLENVPGILAGYAARVIADLAEMGYVGRTGCISAADTGAQHQRNRWWVVAHSVNGRQRQLLQSQRQRECGDPADAWRDGKVCAMANTARELGDERDNWPAISGRETVSESRNDCCAQDLADTERLGSSGQGQRWRSMHSAAYGDRKASIAVGVRIHRKWPTEPDVGRVANGVASRVDRLKALGNGQVPRVVSAAWRFLA